MRPFQIIKDFIHLNRSGDVSLELRSRLFGPVLLGVAALVFLGMIISGGIIVADLEVRLVQLLCVALLGALWWMWKRGSVSLASNILVWGFWLVATLVVLSESGRASHWLVPQFLLIVLARFLINGRLAISLGVLTAAVDFLNYRYALHELLPVQWHELAMRSDWGAIAISFLFLLMIFYVADTVLRETLRTVGLTEGRYRTLFDKTSDAIFLISPELKYLDVNQNALDLLGYTHEEVVGKAILDVVPQEDRESVRKDFGQLEKGGYLPLYERVLVRSDGSRRVAEVNVNKVVDERGKTLYFQSVMRDITERKRLEEQLRISLGEMETLAMQDPLTGLLNRRAITDHAEAEWHRAQRERRPVCIALIDLDNLKNINDTMGHQMGDKVIEQLSTTVKRTIRRYDWAGRWGGDEFMLVLPGTNLVEAQEVTERLRAHYNSSDVIMEIKEDLDPYLSIGIACFSGRSGENTIATQLFEQADQALYQAKHSGKNRIEVFRDSQDEALADLSSV